MKQDYAMLQCYSSHAPASDVIKVDCLSSKKFKIQQTKDSHVTNGTENPFLNRPKVSSTLNISMPVAHSIIGKKKNEHKKISASIQFWHRFSVLIIRHYPHVITKPKRDLRKCHFSHMILRYGKNQQIATYSILKINK